MSESKGPSARRRVLLIDDTKDNCEKIKSGLWSHGFVVDGFTDPLEVISGYKSGRYVLVMTEIRLHHMSGIDLCTKVRDLDPQVKLALLTGYPDFDEARLGELFPELAGVAVIRKPISIGQLAARIDQIVAAHP